MQKLALNELKDHTQIDLLLAHAFSHVAPNRPMSNDEVEFILGSEA